MNDHTNVAVTDTVATAHGITWVRATVDDPPLNAIVTPQTWSVRHAVGDVFIPGGNALVTQNSFASRFFLLMFPPKQLTADMVYLTNVQLLGSSPKQTTATDMLTFLGMIILTTKFEFTTRASLWNTTAWSKYRPAPQFGLTCMSRHRFEELFTNIRWSHQPEVPPVNCTSEACEPSRTSIRSRPQ